jgi:hypothetical protein
MGCVGSSWNDCERNNIASGLHFRTRLVSSLSLSLFLSLSLSLFTVCERVCVRICVDVSVKDDGKQQCVDLLLDGDLFLVILESSLLKTQTNSLLLSHRRSPSIYLYGYAMSCNLFVCVCLSLSVCLFAYVCVVGVCVHLPLCSVGICVSMFECR